MNLLRRRLNYSVGAEPSHDIVNLAGNMDHTIGTHTGVTAVCMSSEVVVALSLGIVRGW